LKKAEPFYYLVMLAALFLIAGLVLFVMQLIAPAEISGTPVDPQVQGQDEAIYDLWFTSVAIYDLGVDHNLTGILFSADNNSVSLLDQERKLRWDKPFTTAPRQAKISSCGNYIVVGTEGGRLHFTSADQQTSWDSEGDPIDLVAISPSASWIAVSRTHPDQEISHLELYSQSGELQWSIETDMVKNLYLSSEYLDQANIYYTTIVDDQPVITALNLKGEVLWSKTGQSLVAVSRYGSRLAALEDNRLLVYDTLGYTLWQTALPFEVTTVIFNPQNYNRVLVYGNREGVGENFYYFDLADDLLWMKRIADGSLFAFTADGQHIVTSSWRHFKEDYTQMVFFDRDGNELTSLEVGMRIEKLIVSGHPHLVVVCGEDGYIDLIDIKSLLTEDSNGLREMPIYSPVTTGLRADETKLTLYFSDENSNLVPVTRSVLQTDNALLAALEELIRGPARGSSLYRTIPDKDVSVNVDLDFEAGRLTLDFSPEFVRMNGSAQSMNALESLLRTVSAFAEVDEIYLTSGDLPLETFGSIILPEQPLAPYEWERAIYAPVSSGSRYYLQPREALGDNTQAVDLRSLIDQLLRTCRALPFVPADLDLINLQTSPEQTQINMNRAFLELFPEDPEETERLQAALILDALFLTVFENSPSQRVEILVNGESWSPPAGYPSTSRFLRQPYFVNPE
jgi:spore germination protein GerM